MARRVTIVMYHFIRDLARSRYPEIKGLNLVEFREQLIYLNRHYTPIAMEDLIEAALSERAKLPLNAVLLTFDDGYIDHFTNVFPLLDEKGIQGSFFPPAKAILTLQLLDVNKIHFVLASVQDKLQIIDFIFEEITANQERFSLNSPQYYYKELGVPNRFDTAEVVFIKRVLQRELPEVFRSEIINKLFRRFVTEDEEAFAAELYMNPEQLACMRRHGMYIGSHGYDHYWLNTLSRPEQEEEIARSLDFLSHLGCSCENWVMCYPYGGFNDSLLNVLEAKRCCIGLTTDVAVADLDTASPLTLPRLDTNDLPKHGSAQPNEWRARV